MRIYKISINIQVYSQILEKNIELILRFDL